VSVFQLFLSSNLKIKSYEIANETIPQPLGAAAEKRNTKMRT